MRILVLNWWDITHPQAGGAELHLHQVFGRIARRAEVTLLCCRHPAAAAAERLDGMWVVRRGGPATINLLAPAWVVGHQARFDVVVEYTNKIPYLTPLYARLPRLCVAHHINGAAFRREFSPPLAAGLMAVERTLYRAVYRRETFTAVSPSTADELAGLGISRRRIHVIYNGVDHVARPALGPRSATPLLLYTGRLKRYKNLDRLLACVRDLAPEVPDLRLAIVGDGDDRGRLMRLAQAWGIAGRVTFCGRVSDDDLARWMSAAWVAVNLSAKEGWGLGIMEAALCGVPAVGADAPGLRDAIRHGETGLLAPPDDPAALRAALLRLLTDAGLRQTLGANARRRAVTFRWADAAEETWRVLEGVSGIRD